MKQVLIKLEHATADVQSVGHKIGEQNKEIADLQAKLDTKDKLLEEALQKIKDADKEEPQEESPIEETEE